ncbi:MAG: TetR/AcrR family transcriptional regulator [Anaerolineae bacterium]
MTTRIYANHRETQREWILQVAEDLFIDKGIEKVTIADIAQTARLTRATLYKYFASKEHMAQQIFHLVTQGWAERNEREVWGIPGSGFERIERFINSHFNYLFQNPREARFVAEFNALYAKEWPVDTMMELLTETLGQDRRNLLETIQQGQADGSVRRDIVPDHLVAVIFNFSSSLLSRLGEFGDKVEGEYGISVQTIFAEISRVFLDGLKAPVKD